MRIAYISADFGVPVFGNKGASIHVRELSLALQKQGHDVRIFTPRAGGVSPSEFDIPVNEISLERPDRVVVGDLQNDPAAGETMAREIRSVMYAVTLRHRLMSLFRTWRPDAIYERYSLLATAGMDIASRLGIPHILEVNAPLSEEASIHRGVAFSYAVSATERRILGTTSHTVAVSEPVKYWAESRGANPDNVTVLPNGVNVERFQHVHPRGTRARYGLDDRPIVGFVGTLKAWHGTDTLIRAIGILSQLKGIANTPRLLIVGDGPQRQHLQELAEAKGVDSIVTFTGSVPHDEIPDLISIMDIAVAPYDDLPDFYFSPLKLFEYMAAGRAIVASDIGQINECIRDGETGLLYPPGDIEALASCIGTLLESPPLIRSLGESARQDAIAHHSWNRNAAIVTSLIERDLARHNDLTGVVASGGSS